MPQREERQNEMKKIQTILYILFAMCLSPALCSAEKPQTESSVSPLEVPWLSTYYIRPQITVNDDAKIGFYVTDWHQSEYRFGDGTHRFNVRLKISDKNTPETEAKELNLKGIKAGDHECNAGKLPASEYIAELSAEDQYGRKSTVLFHEFRVAKDFTIPEQETYRMKESDLEKYKISNKGNYGIFHFFDAKGKNEKETAAIAAEEAAKIQVPSGKYVVVAGAEKFDPDENRNHRGARNVTEPEWLPNPQSWRSCKVLYSGDYNKEQAEADSAVTGKGLNQFLADIRDAGFRKIVMLPGTYRISNTTPIDIPSGLTVDLNNAVIKMNQFAGSGGVQIRIRNGVDSHVVNGIVEGDYFEHDYANSPHNAEWVMGLLMDGESKYSSFERILVRYITGYGAGNGFHEYRGKYIPAKNFTPGTIDEKTGTELPDAEGLAVSALENITPFVKDGGYLTCSRWLGYQGMIGNDWTLRFHFYDKDGNYLETIRGRQYRIVRIPVHAEKVRVTVYTADPKTVNGLIFNCFRKPWNSWFQDLFILSARCVGIAPSAMYNFRFENCTFVRSGEFLAKCAFDAEDGWDMMQDVWIVRNKFFKNPMNELLTCAGHNFIIEDNEGKLHLWSRTNGYVIRNNSFHSASYGAATGRARTGLVRITGNTYSCSVRLGDQGGTVDPALAAVNPSQWVKEDKTQTVRFPWFITMKDFENAKSVSIGSNAMISGATLKDKTLQTVSLAYSTVENCNFGHWISGSSFFKSKIKNITGNVTWDGTLTVTESELENSTISAMNGHKEKGDIIIRNTHLKNVTFPVGYWISPRKMIFENCVIENTDKPVIRTPVYSVGEFSFINCRINTGTAPAIEIYDMRQKHEQPGTIRFENCAIANQKGSIIGINAGISEGSRKKITVIDKNNQYDLKLISHDLSWWETQTENKTAE